MSSQSQGYVGGGACKLVVYLLQHSEGEVQMMVFQYRAVVVQQGILRAACEGDVRV